MDSTLKENVAHGTPQQPMTALHFAIQGSGFYPDHFFVQRHWHNSIEILKIVKGTFKAEINLDEYILSPGDICMIGSGELHQLTGYIKDSIHDAFIFDPRLLSFAYKDQLETELLTPWASQQLSFPHVIRPEDAGYEIFEPYVSRLIRLGLSQEEDWYFKCKLCLLEFLHESWKQNLLADQAATALSAGELEQIDRYKRIVSYMEDHYMRKITLEELADAAGCSSQYICRFFKKLSGETPIQYLITFRVHKAAVMLTETTKTVLEVSLDCGFENISYFIRTFSRIMGATPGQYRKNASKKQAYNLTDTQI